MRKLALAGKLSSDEFERIRSGARAETNPLRALLTSLRSARKRTRAVASLPAGVLAELDTLVARVEARADATRRVTRIVAGSKTRRRESVGA